jgi:hypothetical protein
VTGTVFPGMCLSDRQACRSARQASRSNAEPQTLRADPPVPGVPPLQGEAELDPPWASRSYVQLGAPSGRQGTGPLHYRVGRRQTGRRRHQTVYERASADEGPGPIV